MNDTIKVRIQISPTDELEPEEIERITSTLRAELRGIDNLESVDFARDTKAPPDTMASDPVTLGTLLITVASSGGVLSNVINTLISRFSQSDITEVTINGNTLKISGLDTDQKRELLESFMKKAANSP